MTKLSKDVVEALERILEAARVRHSMNSHAWFPSFAEQVAADIRTVQRLRDALAKGPVAWLYKGEPNFDGEKWNEKLEVTTCEQVAKWKDNDPMPLYALTENPTND